jgi:hypothetical protein
MGIGLKRTIFGPKKTICEKCHKEVQQDRLGTWFCECPTRSWEVYY